MAERRAMALAGVALAAACSGGAGHRRTLARGTLAYAVAAVDDRVVSIELTERFALYVRRPTAPTPLAVIDLGPSDYDLTALAARGGQAWVGGKDGVVRQVDLQRGRVTARWPSGQPITALAVAASRGMGGGVLAAGDDTGTVCLRRLDDGALLQCAWLADQPIKALAVVDGRLVVSAGVTTAWSLPALAADGAATIPPLRWRGGTVAIDGNTVIATNGGRRQTLAAFAGPVHGLAVLGGGAVVIATWVRSLGDPSLVVIDRPGD